MKTTPPEQLGANIEVYFEPAIHPLAASVVEDQLAQVENGDFNTHIWNGAVRERMKSYSPQLIAIDSLTSFSTGNDGQLDTTSKAEIWCSMPGRPSQINGTDEIFVVAGDNTYNAQTALDSSLTDRVLLQGSNVGLWATIGLAAGHWMTKNADTGHQQKMSRRGFVVGAAGALLALNVPDIAAHSPWRFPEPILTKADDVTEDVSVGHIVDLNHEYEYDEGRAALLITKVHDAALAMKGRSHAKVGSVVMGYSHLFQSNDLLSDSTMRADRMRRHTELMLEAAKVDNTSFQGQWTTAQKQQWVMNQESTLQILRVIEPDEARFRQNPAVELNRVITLVGQVQSPSVAKAIEGLI